jgi:antirestriction protein ArdC
MKSQVDLYQAVTDRIVAALEAGNIPWISPWNVSPEQTIPANLSSGHKYRGINVLLLNMTQIAHGYPLNRWLTFQQARGLGGCVRKGEHGSTVVFFKMLDIEDRGTGKPQSDRKVIPLLRSFTVFNAAQIEGLPEALTASPAPATTFTPNGAAEAVLATSGASIQHVGARAFYRPSDDTITLPEKAVFVSPERYYGVALHELTHWTGHPDRCNRPLLGRQHIESYAFEELVAEMGAAFLCNQVGIHNELQHASYIESWLQALKSDKRLIFSAASAAQKACDFLLVPLATEAVAMQVGTTQAAAA